jgi:hypothetical protein
VQSYLVEAYLPRSRARDASASGRRARAAAEELSREGLPIRHVRTTFLPDDETCFHLVQASSAAAVDELCRRAGLGQVRIVGAVET